jgi:hypothetical protein
MAKKKKSKTKAELEAGAQNLADWKAENPSGGNLKHGAYSSQIRQRYSDKRTTEGRRLDAIMKSLANDIGPELSAIQSLILDRVREKLIVLMQIGKYVDQKPSVIDEKGELLSCLGRNYTGFSEALRRDLVALSDLAIKKPSKIPSIKDIVNKANE